MAEGHDTVQDARKRSTERSKGRRRIVTVHPRCAVCGAKIKEIRTRRPDPGPGHPPWLCEPCFDEVIKGALGGEGAVILDEQVDSRTELDRNGIARRLANYDYDAVDGTYSATPDSSHLGMRSERVVPLAFECSCGKHISRGDPYEYVFATDGTDRTFNLCLSCGVDMGLRAISPREWEKLLSAVTLASREGIDSEDDGSEGEGA